MLRRAVDLGLPDDLLFRTLFDIGVIEKRLGRSDAAIAMFTDIAGSRNAFRLRALRELAIHYEHRVRDHAMALDITRRALKLEDTPELRRREQRLQRRAAKNSQTIY
jgi:hypothetical protein